MRSESPVCETVTEVSTRSGRAVEPARPLPLSTSNTTASAGSVLARGVVKFTHYLALRVLWADQGGNVAATVTYSAHQ